jgi:hypothetical protein
MAATSAKPRPLRVSSRPENNGALNGALHKSAQPLKPRDTAAEQLDLGDLE